MLEQAEHSVDSLYGIKKVYVLYEICSSLIVTIDTAKNFFSVMNVLNSRLETKKGALIILRPSGDKKKDELFFGFDEEDIKNRRYNINDDVIRNVAYTKDIVFLVKGEAGIEAKGAQMSSFVDRSQVYFMCVPILNKNDRVEAILVVDRLFDDETSMDKDFFFLRNIANAMSKNLKLKLEIEAEKKILINENDRLKHELRNDYKTGNIICADEEVQKAVRIVNQVADNSAPVLITGETGAGKELIAKALHYNSSRLGNAFTKVYCEAIPEQIFAAELFGTEADSLSVGQSPTKRGKLEISDGGTIYFENIENMPLMVQTRLLKYLNDGEFEKEGIGKVVGVKARIVASSTKNLEQLAKKGEFLTELFYELNIINISLPPLRNRKEDIPLLIKHFIKKYGKDSSKKITDITGEAQAKLTSYNWPGNVRELENCVKRMIALSGGKILDETLLPNNIQQVLEEREKSYEGGVESVIDSILKDKLDKIVSFFGMRKQKKTPLYKKIIDNIDRILIEIALKKCGGIQIDAASFLGINRNTLRTKIEKLGVDANSPKESAKTKGNGRRNMDLPFK